MRENDLAVYQLGGLLAELEELVGDVEIFPKKPTRREELRASIEKRYATHLPHARLTQTPEPDSTQNPEAHAQWMGSRSYMTTLQAEQPRLAGRVRRYITPLQEGINMRYRDWTEDRYEFGEFYNLVPPVKIVKPRQILEGVNYYDEELTRLSYGVMYDDVELQMRKAGDAWTANGKQFYHPGDPEQQAEWERREAERARHSAELNAQREIYVRLLPPEIQTDLDVHLKRLREIKEEEQERLLELIEGS